MNTPSPAEEPQTLRQRCKAICDKMARDAMLRQGSAVETLLEFVLAEKGRAADKSLDETLPLVLYFGNEADRDEFIQLVQAAKPNMVARKLP